MRQILARCMKPKKCHTIGGKNDKGFLLKWQTLISFFSPSIAAKVAMATCEPRARGSEESHQRSSPVPVTRTGGHVTRPGLRCPALTRTRNQGGMRTKGGLAHTTLYRQLLESLVHPRGFRFNIPYVSLAKLLGTKKHIKALVLFLSFKWSVVRR